MITFVFTSKNEVEKLYISAFEKENHFSSTLVLGAVEKGSIL